MLTFGISVDLQLRNELTGEALATAKKVVSDWNQQKMVSPRAMERRFTSVEQTYNDGAGDVWRLELRQSGDFGGTWITEVQILQASGRTRDATATIVMRLEFDEAAVAPARYYVEPPVFLKGLSTAFHVYVGGTEVPTAAKHADTEDDVEALQQEMENRHRSLPIVVVTDPAAEAPLIPGLADLLASALFGMAIVTHASRRATFALSRELGREMSCFDGAVRIYWPGWRATDTPYAHPLFLKERVAASAKNDPGRPELLIRTALLVPLVRAVASRFSYPLPMRAVLEGHQRRALEQEFKGRSQDDALARLADLNQLVVEKGQLFELALTENAELRSKLDGLQAQLTQAAFELEQARKALPPAPPATAGEELPEIDESPWAIATAKEAVDRARAEFAATLLIPTNVYIETSMDGGYWYHVLLSLHKLCELERQGQATNKRAQLRQLLVENVGVSKDTYKTAETGIYATHPETEQRVQLRERVHLQEGRPAETESVYWQTVGEAQQKYRYLIGRIGRHA